MATNIIMTKIISSNAVTHAGIFHGDDVLATALLSYVLPEVRVSRVFRVEKVNPDAIVFDIGMVYDPESKRFDHHMRSFKEHYDDGIKLSSLGLLWREYGDMILKDLGLEENLVPSAWGMVLNDLIKGIDAQDNGQLSSSNPRTMTISNVISQFNPNWDDDFSSDEGFLKAVHFAQTVLENTLRSAISRARGRATVEEAIDNARNGIIVLPKFVPWQGIVAHTPQAQDALFVVFPSTRGGYSIQGIKIDPRTGNDLRKPLPESWAGLQDKAMANASGVEDATFCHIARFIASAKTLESAMRLAELAVAE